MKQKNKRCKADITRRKAMAKYSIFSKVFLNRFGQQRHNEYIQPTAFCSECEMHTHLPSRITPTSFVHFEGHNGFFLLLKIIEQKS